MKLGHYPTLLLIGLSFFLPATPITQASIQTYPAQAAYFKDAGSFLVLAFFFFLFPAHFVLTVQSLERTREGADMDGQAVLSAAVRLAVYPRFWALCSLLLLFAVIAVAGTAHLLDNLKPGPYQNLFVQLLYLKEILYFGFGLYCLLWYYRIISRIRSERPLGRVQIERF